ncbi:acyl-CoA thioester hydrolase/BAAT C-terminal domain-containing protein [Salinigranum sp. GCM10025319]|uniref:acyl-CoA thioester hydrolase/BAAT C-terminal domain-containing protein n=1 Tax=Salinigranum sp. GCM10025319 TaxID=3252687 RepID=UPI003612EB2C
MTPTRRRYLEAVAGGSVASLAGCVDRLRDLRAGTTIHAPSTAAVTDRLDVEVTGLDSREPVWVEAHTTDGSGHEWFGRVLVDPDRDRVALRDAQPRRGTYRAPSGMGLFWSMQPADLDRLVYDADQRVQSVRLRVVPDGSGGVDEGVSPLTETTVDRRLAAPESTETDLTEPIVGTLVEPPTDGPAPGVVLFHGSSGNRSLAPARVLASRGFTVLALQYFSPEYPRLPDALVEVPVEYADRAVEWLADHEATTDDPIGLGGFSRGGELALLVGTRHEVSAVVNWVGAGLLFNAVVLGDDLGVSDQSPDTSAWTVGGDPLPHPSRDDFELGGNLTDAYRAWLDATPEETIEAAEIPLEQVEAPILLVSAGDDGVWPSRYLLNRAEKRLDAPDYAYRVEHHSYDDAGHGIGVPVLPTWPNRPGGPFGGTLAGTAAAEADSWPRAVEFFERGVER